MDEELFELSASVVTVEVKDERTGKIYRRLENGTYLEVGEHDLSR